MMVYANNINRISSAPELKIAVFISLFLVFAIEGAEIRIESVAELPKAIAKARPGDSLVLANGVYRDLHIEFYANGKKDQPITLRAETPGEVILSGRSRLNIYGKHLVVDGLYFKDGYAKIREDRYVVSFRKSTSELAEHCRLTNTAIIDYNPPSKDDGSKWVSIYGSQNRVDHCFFAGKSNSGATLVAWLTGEPNYHLIDHNHFAHRPRLGSNSGETIRIGTSQRSMSNSRTIVEYNYFDACDGEIEIISNKSCENIYRHNTFVRCWGTLSLRHGNRCVVEGNFFLGHHKKGTGGVRVIGEDHKVINNYFQGTTGRAGAAVSIHAGVSNSPLNEYFVAKNLLLAFNTFVDNKGCCIDLSNGLGDSGASEPPENCLIANNVIQGDGSPLIIGKAVGTRWQGNIAYGGELGIPATAGIKVVDPKLEKDSNGLWRPASSSPVIGAGEGNYSVIMEDIDGQPREQKRDIGCDQVSDEPVKHHVLTPQDVGPIWMLKESGN
jgi:poly(beta-D-mannuronate) lyase